MAFKDYRKESRGGWGKHQEDNLDTEQLSLGCLLRIADSLEKIEKPYKKLIDDYNDMSQTCDVLSGWYETEKRRVAAYRGIIKRLKEVERGRR